MNRNIPQNIEGQKYIDCNEFLNKFFRELEPYDHNIYQYYFGNEFKNNVLINTNFINNFMNNIIQPSPNTKEYKIYNNLKKSKDELIKKIQYLPNQFLNENLMKIIKSNKKEVQINYGSLQFNQPSKCNNCYKDYQEASEESDDAIPIQLIWCKHTFCKRCLRNYIIKSTNNLIFLTRQDNANNNKRTLRCLNKECEFILFLEDYSNVFGDELFSIIQNNYFNRIKQLSNIKLSKLFCLSCGTDKVQDCYICPQSNQNMNDPDCHCLCLECSEFYYMKCRRINNDRTIVRNLPCPLPFCNANVISIKEKLIIKKKSDIKNISLNKPKLENIKKLSFENNNINNSIINFPIKPKPSFKTRICVCGDDENQEFSHDYICNNNHYMHLECIVSCIQANVDNQLEKTFKEIFRCPFIEGGNHYLNIDYIMSILDYKQQEKLLKVLLKLQMEDQETFECLNLNCDGFNFIIDKNSLIVTCPQCCSSYCMSCKKFAHGKISCEGGNREELIAIGFMPCPYCYELFAKDDKCNHVKCSNCKQDFCFRCSAKRTPIMYHGNHYHRKTCTDYFVSNEKDDFNEKCDCCTIIKRKTGNSTTCPRPQDLEKGDIPISEREFNGLFEN